MEKNKNLGILTKIVFKKKNKVNFFTKINKSSLIFAKKINMKPRQALA